MPENPRVEPAEDKDLQDHKMGMKAAEMQEEVEGAGTDDPRADDDTRRPEPHAGGRA